MQASSGSTKEQWSHSTCVGSFLKHFHRQYWVHPLKCWGERAIERVREKFNSSQKKTNARLN